MGELEAMVRVRQSIQGWWSPSHLMPRIRSYLESISRTWNSSTQLKSENFTRRSINDSCAFTVTPVASLTAICRDERLARA